MRYSMVAQLVIRTVTFVALLWNTVPFWIKGSLLWVCMTMAWV